MCRLEQAKEGKDNLTGCLVVIICRQSEDQERVVNDQLLKQTRLNALKQETRGNSG